MRTDARTHGFRLSAGALLLGSIVACSSSTGGHTVTTDDNNTAGQTGSGDTGGEAGTANSAGSGGTAENTGGSNATGGDVATSGSGGSGGDVENAGSVGVGGDAGTGGTADTGGAGGTGGAPNLGFTGPFDCTLVAGLLVTSEWYNAGFENDGVDGNKWEGKFQHYGYIDIWAKDSADGGFAWDAALTSPCAAHSLEPDRVLFTAWSWEIADEATYVSTTVAAVNKFIQNFPSMKRMELMTIVRCPPNASDPATAVSGQQCNPNAAVPPIAGVTDHNAGQQDCQVAPYIDSALDAVAAQFPGLVYVGKKFYSPACRAPVDGAHLGDNNNQVAQDIATYYATLP